MPRIRRLFNGCALVAITAGPAVAAGLSPDDLVGLARISDPQVSPDGGQVTFTLRETDREADRGRTDIWVLDLGQDGPPRQLTTHAEADSAARWSPNGERIYFLSSRSGNSQVWRMSMHGGDPLQVTDYPLAVTGFALAPNGKTLVVSASVFADCGADLDCTAKRNSAADEASNSGTRYGKLFVRHWDTWKDGTRSGLFSQPLDEDGRTTGKLAYLTDGIDADVPSAPFGGMEEIAISADSRRVAFSARIAGVTEPWSTNFDIYEVAIGGGSKQNLTRNNPAWDTSPVYTPDGTALVWLAMSRPGFEADRFRLLERNLKSNKVRAIAPDWDRSPASLTIGAGGELYATANDTGRRTLFQIDRKTGSIEPLTSVGWVGAVAPSKKGGPLVVVDSLHEPADLYRIDTTTGSLQQLTAVNADALAGIQFGSYEQFNFSGWNDETVYGYVMSPVGARPGERYPIAFLIHGGPQGSFGNHFHYRWNPQTYAAEGYAVVFIDFHGSTGYGQAFTDSIQGDWGGKPLVDLQKGLAAAISRYEWLDGTKACALGASYGGYMVNWIAGNWPDRFRCLVNHDGVFDNRMMYYTTEELWFPEWEHGGPYFSASNGFEKHNPVTYVNNWETPMLVVHGALDYRVPETQGIAAFTALQRRGVASEFLYFPDENHWVLRPSNSVQWHDAVNGWLARYLK